MYQVHVVDSGNRQTYQPELDQHHRIRHEIFIRERHWRDLRQRNGREWDQFDGPQAIYLLGIEPGLGVVAGSRLLPTTQPTLLSGVFPQLANMRDIPAGPDILEWTRLFVVASRREERRLARWAGAVKCAMLEYCLDEGITTLTGVAETFWFPRIMQMGWMPRPLGLPIEHDGLTLVAFSADPTEAMLESTRRFYGIEGPCLYRDPFSVNPLHVGRRSLVERPVLTS